MSAKNLNLVGENEETKVRIEEYLEARLFLALQNLDKEKTEDLLSKGAQPMKGINEDVLNREYPITELFYKVRNSPKDIDFDKFLQILEIILPHCIKQSNFSYTKATLNGRLSRTIMHDAIDICENIGHYDIVRLLIDFGITPIYKHSVFDTYFQNDTTIIQYAEEKIKNPELFKLIVDTYEAKTTKITDDYSTYTKKDPENKNFEERQEMTVLYKLCSNKKTSDEELLKLICLLDKGCNINKNYYFYRKNEGERKIIYDYPINMLVRNEKYIELWFLMKRNPEFLNFIVNNEDLSIQNLIEQKKDEHKINTLLNIINNGNISWSEKDLHAYPDSFAQKTMSVYFSVLILKGKRIKKELIKKINTNLLDLKYLSLHISKKKRYSKDKINFL